MSIATLSPCDSIRLATLADVPRIAFVAAAGFFWSPTFQYQRPYHEAFPEDTLSSYWLEYKSSIVDPTQVVLVAEDTFEPTESAHVYEALRRSILNRPGKSQDARVVVGVCSIVLKPGSPHAGSFYAHNQLQSSPEMETDLTRMTRDQNPEAMRKYAEATGPVKKKYLAGEMRLGTLAVHPKYWRRGHATRLVNWCVKLADKENVAVGISATPMGASLVAQVGFQQREIVRLRQSSEPRIPKAVDVALWIGVRPPSGSSSVAASETASKSPSSENSPL